MSVETKRWIVGGIAGTLIIFIGYQYASEYLPRQQVALQINATHDAFRKNLEEEDTLSSWMEIKNNDPECKAFVSIANDIHLVLGQLKLGLGDTGLGEVVKVVEQERLLSNQGVLTKIIQFREYTRNKLSDAGILSDMPSDQKRLDVLCDLLPGVSKMLSLSSEVKKSLDQIIDQSFIRFLKEKVVELSRY